ncbi:MAG: cache domain-containing protein, partial [Ignavibacteriales bacterium]
MKLKMKGRIISGNLMGLLVFSVILFITVTIGITNLVNEEVSQKLDSIVDLSLALADIRNPGDWHIGTDGKLYKGKTLVETTDKNPNSTNRVNAFMDFLGKTGGSYITVFKGDSRVATNIVKKNAQGVLERPYGTKCAEEVRKAIFDDKKDYFIGTVDVAGIQCRAKYVPLKDKDGKLIGMFFAGVDREKIQKMVSDFTVIAVLVIIGCCILFISICYVLYDRITGRLTKVANIMKEVEETNDLTLQSDVVSVDESGDLSRDFNGMVSKFKKIVKDVKNSSVTVLSSSEKLAASTEESGASMEEIAASVNSIARGMLDNSKIIVNTSENVKQV